MKTQVIITVSVELSNGDLFYFDWNGPSETSVKQAVRRRYPEARSIQFGEATVHHSWGAH